MRFSSVKTRFGFPPHLIHVSAMSDPEGQDLERGFGDLHKDAIATDAISPRTSVLGRQTLAALSRIIK